MRGSRAWGQAMAGALALLLAAQVASAAPTEAEKARARALLNEGYDLMEQGEPKSALTKFQQADDLLHFPITGLSVARAQTAMGQLLEAQVTLQHVISDIPRAGEPPAFAQARKDAQELQKKVAGLVPAVRIKLVKAPPQTTLKVDGKTVDIATLGTTPYKVDPGLHEIVASADGDERKVTLTVQQGQTTEATLDYTEAPPAAVPPQPGTASAPGTATTAETPATGSGIRWLSWAGFGVGVAGLAAGGVTGFLALQDRDAAVNSGCSNGKCPPAAQSHEHDAQQMATISTIAFGVGLAGVAVGVVGLLLPSKAEGASASGPRHEGVHAHLELGPTYLGVAGDL